MQQPGWIGRDSFTTFYEIDVPRFLLEKFATFSFTLRTHLPLRSVLVWRDREFDTGGTNEWKRTVAECKKYLHVALSLNEAYFYRILRFILIVWKI